jgi:integrase
MAERITDKLVRSLIPPAKGNRIIYDTDIRGFGVRVTAAGARSFVLNYYASRRERRYTIGSYPEWSVQAARGQAAELKRSVDRGSDPLETRQESRGAPTMSDLFQRYEAEHLPRKAPRSAADDRSMWKKIILPELGHRKAAAITHDDCDRLHSEIARDRPVRANRVIEVLRKAMNLAIRWGWRADNPASGVHRSAEERRERYLSQDEVSRLLRALSDHPERTSATAIRLMLLTGCRRSEALAARWEEFDLADGIWTKPSAHTKQRKVHRAPLSNAAINLLRDWKTTVAGEFVFPGRDGRALTDVKKTWEAVRRKAELQGVRLHDLRHTQASFLASIGENLHIIGQVLGHTQPRTTARYAHLVDDVLRKAMNRAAVHGGLDDGISS